MCTIGSVGLICIKVNKGPRTSDQQKSAKRNIISIEWYKGLQLCNGGIRLLLRKMQSKLLFTTVLKITANVYIGWRDEVVNRSASCKTVCIAWRNKINFEQLLNIEVYILFIIKYFIVGYNIPTSLFRNNCIYCKNLDMVIIYPKLNVIILS